MRRAPSEEAALQGGGGAPGDAYRKSLASLGKGTLIISIGTILYIGLNFVGRVAVVRLFSIDNWGNFSFGLAFVGFLSSVALLGLGNSAARSLSYETEPGERWAIIRWSIGVASVASVGTSVAVYLLSGSLAAVFRNPGLVPVFQLLSPAIGFTIIASLLASFFRGFEDTIPNALWVQMTGPLLFLVFLGGFLAFHLSFTGVLLAYSGSLAVGLAGLSVHAWRGLPKLVGGRHVRGRRPKRTLWSLSISLWSVSSLSVITAYADTLILAGFWPAKTVGLYTASMTLAKVLLVSNGALTFIYLPVAARLSREEDLETLQRTYVTSTRWVLGGVLPLFLLFFVTPSLTLVTVFGRPYSPAATSLQILALGTFVSILVGPVNVTLAGYGLARTLMKTSLFAALINVTLSFGLIPTFGIMGASVAWCAARAAYPGSGLVALHQVAGVNPFRRILLFPILVSLAIEAPIFWGVQALHPPHWVVVPLYFCGVVIFFAAVLATRSVDAGDVLIVRALERAAHRPLPRLHALLERFMAPGPTRATPGTSIHSPPSAPRPAPLPELPSAEGVSPRPTNRPLRADSAGPAMGGVPHPRPALASRAPAALPSTRGVLANATDWADTADHRSSPDGAYTLADTESLARPSGLVSGGFPVPPLELRTDRCADCLDPVDTDPGLRVCRLCGRPLCTDCSSAASRSGGTVACIGCLYRPTPSR